MLPFQQTVVAGLILFVVYELYASLVAGLKPLEAARESMCRQERKLRDRRKV
jgi:hypothetical protein